MIILDTNVLSALMRRQPDAAVAAWLDGQLGESVWTTAVTVFEIRYGLCLLEEGRRRRELERAFGRALEEELGGRILAFDRVAAEAAAGIAAARRAAGRPVDIRDLQIAGIAVVRRGTLATRNIRDFEATEVALVDPWAAGQGRGLAGG